MLGLYFAIVQTDAHSLYDYSSNVSARLLHSHQ